MPEKKLPPTTTPSDPEADLQRLIDDARKRDTLAASDPTRQELVAALRVLGRTYADAEREVDNARERMRRAATKAEATLASIMSRKKLWAWTLPLDAVQMMRRHYFHGYDDAPLTDIEQALVQKGNALMIIAIYGTLKGPILARLGRPASPIDELQ